MFSTGKRAETAGDFLFYLGHAHVAFSNVVGERHGLGADEEQDSVGVQAEAAQHRQGWLGQGPS